MAWLYLVLLYACSAAIAYQDFTKRLISLWLILVTGLISVSWFIYSGSLVDLLFNTIFCAGYFTFSFLILFLWFYLRKRNAGKVALSKMIGLGDILIFGFIGITLDPVSMIYFFTASFILSVLIFMLLMRGHKTVPLAGFMVIFYSLFSTLRHLYPELI